MNIPYYHNRRVQRNPGALTPMKKRESYLIWRHNKTSENGRTNCPDTS